MSELPEVDLFWFNEAKRMAAEIADLKKQLHGTRGLYYGACAARTEKAVEIGAQRRRIAELEARVLRAPTAPTEKELVHLLDVELGGLFPGNPRGEVTAILTDGVLHVLARAVLARLCA